MNRDALLATIIGFGVGLLIMGILLVGPNVARFLPNLTLPNLAFLQRKNQPAPTPTTAGDAFTIDSPLPDAIETASDVLVSGKAVAGSTVVLQGPLDEAVVTATAEATYAGRVKLTEGANEIIVTMYAGEETMSQSISIYYTPEEF